MNRSILFLLMLSAAVSCSKLETAINGDSPKYTGTMAVEYQGETYMTENVAVQAAVSSDGRTVDLKLLKVKFVPQMPVLLDITVPGIPVVSESGETLSFAGEGIVPYALGGPFRKFTVSGLTGALDGTSLAFSLKFGDYPTSYQGERINNFN